MENFMIIYAHNIKYPYLLVFDIEFDQTTLVQFCGLLFKRVGDGIYQLARSCNQYVALNKVSYPFQQYTGITKQFLQDNGTRLTDVVQVVLDEFLEDVDKSQMLVISHGLKNDRKILLENKLNLMYDEKTLKDIDGYCTFCHAKTILKRNNNLKLDDLARECGFYLDGAHNAFHDAWATVAVFTWLQKLEGEK